MSESSKAFADWTPEQIAMGRLWVETWREAGPALERLRRRELRTLDTNAALALLCGPVGMTVGTLRSGSGLVEQQRWFKKVARNP